MMRRPDPSHPAPRAFALVAAVLMISLIASAFVTLTSLFAYQADRTRSVDIDAQLRQFLIGGALDLAGRAEAWRESRAEHWVVATPPDLEATVTVDVEPAPGGHLLCKVEAEWRDRHKAQQLLFARGDTGFELLEVVDELAVANR